MKVSALLCALCTLFGMISVWPPTSVELEVSPLASAIRYQNELSPHSAAAIDCAHLKFSYGKKLSAQTDTYRSKWTVESACFLLGCREAAVDSAKEEIRPITQTDFAARQPP